MYFDENRIMEDGDIVKSLVALARFNRFQIFKALVVSDREGVNPGALAGSLGAAGSKWPQPDLPCPIQA